MVQHSYVDYTWLGEAQLQVRHPLNGRARHCSRTATGSCSPSTGPSPAAARRRGGRIEAGIRLNGRGGAMELFAGYEKRVDADPLDRQSAAMGPRRVPPTQ